MVSFFGRSSASAADSVSGARCVNASVANLVHCLAARLRVPKYACMGVDQHDQDTCTAA